MPPIGLTAYLGIVLLGGLNYLIEHHLFPDPQRAPAPMVRDCRDADLTWAPAAASPARRHPPSMAAVRQHRRASQMLGVPSR